MASFTDAQFQTLLAQMAQLSTNANPPAQPQETPDANPPPTTQRNDPSALGPMAPCTLGTNKMTKLTKFEEWVEEAENRMEYIGHQEDKDKIILLKSWGGSELNEFMKTYHHKNNKTTSGWRQSSNRSRYVCRSSREN